MNVVSEPQTAWGGPWTVAKLNAFSKYVAAYLTIMSKQKRWKTIYFDGFAGSGTRYQNKNIEVLNLIQFDEADENIYKGSAERVLSLPNELSFDFHYFIDLDEESLSKLKGKLSGLQKRHRNKFQYKPGDCNRWIRELAQVMHDKPNEYAALVLLDPFGMQIDWIAIESLNKTRSDVWILVPTGVIVNRLLDKNGELTHIDKLESFFGLREEEIRKYFYRKEKRNTLFGEMEIVEKINNPIQKISELYIQRLKTIWKYVSNTPLILLNKKGCPIYHFIFASNNSVAEKIAHQIITKL